MKTLGTAADYAEGTPATGPVLLVVASIRPSSPDTERLKELSLNSLTKLNTVTSDGL